MQPNDAVILVHGHGANRFFMLPMQHYLQKRGYQVHNRTYPSKKGSIALHADTLFENIKPLVDNPLIPKLHFVGHSMGAIVVRQLLATHPIPKLGRIVLLAPPNRGAKLADFALKILKCNPPLAAQELSTRNDSLVNQLPCNPDHDIGVIAASLDHIVPLDLTHLPGQRDHLVLKSLHTVPLHYQAPRQVHHFLQRGKFERRAGFSKS